MTLPTVAYFKDSMHQDSVFSNAGDDSECEISSSHGGEYDVQSCLLGCTVNILHGSTTQKTALNMMTLNVCHAGGVKC
jgi:hypothetical protein